MAREIKLFNGQTGNANAIVQNSKATAYAAPTKLLKFIAYGETSSKSLESPAVNLVVRTFTFAAVVATGILPAFFLAKVVTVLTGSENKLDGATEKAIDAFKTKQKARVGLDMVGKSGGYDVSFNGGILSLLKGRDQKTLAERKEKAMKELAVTIGRQLRGVKSIDDCYKVANAFVKDIKESLKNSEALGENERDEFIEELKTKLHDEMLRNVVARMVAGTDVRRRGLGDFTKVLESVKSNSFAYFGINAESLTEGAILAALKKIAKEEVSSAKLKEVTKALTKEKNNLRANGKPGQQVLKAEMKIQKAESKESKQLEKDLKKADSNLKAAYGKRAVQLKVIADALEYVDEKRKTFAKESLEGIRTTIVDEKDALDETKKDEVDKRVNEALSKNPGLSAKATEDLKAKSTVYFRSQVEKEFAPKAQAIAKAFDALKVLEKLEGNAKKGGFEELLKKHQEIDEKLKKLKIQEDSEIVRKALIAQDDDFISFLASTSKKAKVEEGKGKAKDDDTLEIPKEILANSIISQPEQKEPTLIEKRQIAKTKYYLSLDGLDRLDGRVALNEQRKADLESRLAALDTKDQETQQKIDDFVDEAKNLHNWNLQDDLDADSFQMLRQNIINRIQPLVAQIEETTAKIDKNVEFDRDGKESIKDAELAKKLEETINAQKVELSKQVDGLVRFAQGQIKNLKAEQQKVASQIERGNGLLKEVEQNILKAKEQIDKLEPQNLKFAQEYRTHGITIRDQREAQRKAQDFIANGYTDQVEDIDENDDEFAIESDDNFYDEKRPVQRQPVATSFIGNPALTS
jgi:hypothetical protein